MIRVPRLATRRSSFLAWRRIREDFGVDGSASKAANTAVQDPDEVASRVTMGDVVTVVTVVTVLEPRLFGTVVGGGTCADTPSLLDGLDDDDDDAKYASGARTS